MVVGGSGGGLEQRRENKGTGEKKSVSRHNFKFTVSDVDKCISDKMTLDFVHCSGN